MIKIKPVKVCQPYIPSLPLDSVWVTNNLTKKPEEGVKRLKKYIEDTQRRTWHYVGISQDYSKGIINMCFGGNCLVGGWPKGSHYFNWDIGEKIATGIRELDGAGLDIKYKTQIPITSSSKKYVQALKEMILQDEKDIIKRNEERRKDIYRSAHRKSFIQKLKDSIGI